MERTSSRRASRAIALPFLAALALPLSAQTTQLVSVSSSGAQGDGPSGGYGLDITADGRFLAFVSYATNLVPGDTNVLYDVFLRDRLLGTIERASVGANGVEGNLDSKSCSVSEDGRCVAFTGDASNLVSGDTNGKTDAFVRDRQTGITERVSIGAAGIQGDGHSLYPVLSADGRYVAFQSDATNLVAGDTNTAIDVFVRDRQSGITSRVSVGPGGVAANDACTTSALSADGRYVAFQSQASNLVAGDTNANMDVFVRDRVAGVTERVSVASGGSQAHGWSVSASISADGRYVTFESDAGDLVPGDTNSAVDVFVHDRLSGTTARVDLGPGGSEASGGPSYGASISADGGFVSFLSSAVDLVPGDTNGVADVFVRDLRAGTTERVSVASNGAQANGISETSAVSDGGRHVLFLSHASNLVAGDVNGWQDAFLRERVPTFSSFCAGDGVDTSHTTPCPCGNDGAPGNGCANSAENGGAHLRASGATSADDVELHGSAMPATSACIYLQGDALDDATFGDGVRCTGGTLIRLRARTNAGGASSFPDSTDTVALSTRGGVTPGSGLRRYYQTYYRNAAAAFCPPETFNVTNGVIVDW